jgi:hypothetical protein
MLVTGLKSGVVDAVIDLLTGDHQPEVDGQRAAARARITQAIQTTDMSLLLDLRQENGDLGFTKFDVFLQATGVLRCCCLLLSMA